MVETASIKRRALFSLWVSMVLTLSSGTGWAQLRVIGNVHSSVGFSDNVLGSVDGTVGDVADGFVSVSPRVTLGYEGATTLHYLEYTFNYFLYMQHPDVSTYGNRLGYSVSVQPSAHTRLSFSAGGTQGKRQVFNLLEGADRSDPNVLADDRISETFVSFDAVQGLTWEITPVWELLQSIAFEAVIPLESDRSESKNYTVGGRFGVGRTFSFDALGLVVGVDFFTFGEVEIEGSDPQPEQHGLASQTYLQWLHDLTPAWSTELRGGVTAAVNPDDPDVHIVHPLAFGAIRYRRERWRLGLEAEHSAEPDLLTSRMTLDNAVRLNASYPLDREGKWVTQATAGYRYSIFYAPGDWTPLADGYHGILCDAALSWGATRFLFLDVRYQFMRVSSSGGIGQFADGGAVTQHTAMLGLTLTYPPEGIPLRVPSLRRTRADRGLR
jgi:hypothetical protein